MPRLLLSFTEPRRRTLALKVIQLDRLEARSTVTQFTAFSLATGEFQSLAQIGLMQNGGGNAPSSPTQPDAATQGASLQPKPAQVKALGASGNFLPINIVPMSSSGGGGGSGAPAVPDVAPVGAKSSADDKLAAALAPSSDPSSSTGITAPWKPASRPGGGAAMPPRGGSGSGAQPAVTAMVTGHSALPAATQAPAPPPTIPGLYNGSTPTTATQGFPAPAISRNAAAQGLNPSSGSTSDIASAPVNPPGTTTTATGTTHIIENRSSLPSSTVRGGMAPDVESFPYFQLYTLDDDSGVVLYPGQYQQATLGGNVNLIAQVSGSTGPYTYSWNTSSL